MVLVASFAGCQSVRPVLRYSTPTGDPPALEAADRAEDSLQQSLDNLDLLVENAVY